jgi:hypothetical protein
MAESTIVKVRRDGLLTIQDGTGTPLTYTVAYENGNVSFSREKADRIVIRDRGAIVGSRKGDDPVLSVTFDVHMRMLTTTAGTDLTLIDVLDNGGNVATIPWVKTNTAHEEWCLDLVFTIEGSDHGDGADYTATFADCIFTWDFSEGDPNTISVTAECMGGYTSTGPS